MIVESSNLLAITVWETLISTALVLANMRLRQTHLPWISALIRPLRESGYCSVMKQAWTFALVSKILSLIWTLRFSWLIRIVLPQINRSKSIIEASAQPQDTSTYAWSTLSMDADPQCNLWSKRSPYFKQYSLIRAPQPTLMTRHLEHRSLMTSYLLCRTLKLSSHSVLTQTPKASRLENL